MTNRELQRWIAANPRWAKGGTMAPDAPKYLDQWDGAVAPPDRLDEPAKWITPNLAAAYCGKRGLPAVDDVPMVDFELRTSGSGTVLTPDNGPVKGDQVLSVARFRCRD
ncbi:MAG: hypothetical protein ABMB14_11340 [Myxococcota bacterium]